MMAEYMKWIILNGQKKSRNLKISTAEKGEKGWGGVNIWSRK